MIKTGQTLLKRPPPLPLQQPPFQKWQEQWISGRTPKFFKKGGANENGGDWN